MIYMLKEMRELCTRLRSKLSTVNEAELDEKHVVERNELLKILDDSERRLQVA